jgi:hypothetical protein
VQYVAAGRCDGTTFLLNKRTGRYYKLDDVSSELWTLLRRPLDMEDILRALGTIYDVPPQVLAEDVEGLVTILLDYDVIEMS